MARNKIGAGPYRKRDDGKITTEPAEDIEGELIIPDPPRTRNMERELTPEEVDELRADWLTDSAEIERLQADGERLAKEAKEKKQRAEVLIKEGLESARMLKRGMKWTDVECYYRDNKIGSDWIRIWYRSDTMAEIDREPVPAGERQTGLFTAPTTDPVDDQF